MLKVSYLKVSDWNGRGEGFFFPPVSLETRRFISGIGNESVRRRKILGEYMVRTLLSRHFALEGCRLGAGIHGKPYVVDADIPAFFNISHSGDYVVCAVSDGEVGVDIEHRGRMRMGVARRFFHAAEVERLDRLDEGEQDYLFTGLWSVKESYLKYTGTGLSASPGSFEVYFGKEGIGLEKAHSRIPVCVRECMVDPDYRCFVCSASVEAPEVSLFVL